MLTGGCNCGGVRYEIDEPLVSASYCHCTRCQRRTGAAASANARIEPGSLRIVKGEELVKTWWPPDGHGKSFCSECGSHLWSQDPDERQIRGVRLGTLDGDPAISPQWHQFTNYAATWEPIPEDGLARYPEGRPPNS